MLVQSEKLLVRCHGCKGTQIFKFDPETNEIEVFHDCIHGNHAKEIIEKTAETAAFEMLSRIRASLEGWPMIGCDIKIAEAVVKIRDEAIKASLVEKERR